MTKAEYVIIFLAVLLLIIYNALYYFERYNKKNKNHSIWKEFTHSKAESECPLCGQKAQWDFEKEACIETTKVTCENCNHIIEICVTVTDIEEREE